MQFSPYLNFDGHCKEAFAFYADLLGGEIIFMSTFAEAPDDAEISAGLKDKIMHAQLKVGDQVIMASDASPQNYDIPRGINITIGVDTPEEAERIYEALAEGGSVRMPMEETFWAKRFGMVSDRFGIPWMVNCDK